MVTGRLQEEDQGTSGVSERLNADVVKSWNGKRKSEELVDGMSGQTFKKRRKSSPMKEQVVADRERTSPINSLEAQMNDTSLEESETIQHILPLTDNSTNMTSTHVATDKHSYACRSVMENAMHLDEDLDMVVDHEQDRSSSKVRYGSNTSKKMTVVDNQAHGSDKGLIAGFRSGVQSFTDPDTLEVKKPIHKRFGSEELQTSIVEANGAAKYDEPVDSDKKKGDQAKAESDSEDEVPEIVTASAGLSQARSIAAEEAKAVATYGSRDLRVNIDPLLIYRIDNHVSRKRNADNAMHISKSKLLAPRSNVKVMFIMSQTLTLASSP